LAVGLISLNVVGLVLFSSDPYYTFLAGVLIVTAVISIVRHIRALETERDELKARARRFQEARTSSPLATDGDGSTLIARTNPVSGVESELVSSPIIQCLKCGTWESRADSAYCRKCGAHIP